MARSTPPSVSGIGLVATYGRQGATMGRLPIYASDEERDRAKLDAALRAKYDIGVEDYDDLMKIQGGLCAICRRPCSSGRRLAVDHDHESDEIRGLLCTKCNMAVGFFDDDAEIVRNALRYLLGRQMVTLAGENQLPMFLKDCTEEYLIDYGCDEESAPGDLDAVGIDEWRNRDR
jgi:hypothetical protein